MKFEVNVNHAGFTGKAEIDFPTRKEKTELLSRLKSVSASDEEEGALTAGTIHNADLMGEIIETRLISINVKHEESGIEIKEKEFLDVYTEGQTLSGILANMVLGGVSILGK